MPDLSLVHRSEPPDAERAEPPAVVLLHGRGADEDDLLPVGRQLPGDPHVLSARAPDRLGPGYSWYELDLSGGGLHESQPDAADFRRSRESLDEFVDGAVDAYGLDPDRLGVLGFSQGAILALATVLERPDRFAWCATLHGYLPESHADLDAFDGIEGFPVFLGAGEADDVIPVERARRAAEALSAAGLDVTVETYPTGHGIGREELRAVVEWAGDRPGFGRD